MLAVGLWVLLGKKRLRPLARLRRCGVRAVGLARRPKEPKGQPRSGRTVRSLALGLLVVLVLLASAGVMAARALAPRPNGRGSAVPLRTRPFCVGWSLKLNLI